MPLNKTTGEIIGDLGTDFRNQEHLYPYVFKLEPALVGALRTIGRWGRPH
jgi:hypothetical protein